MNPQSCVDQNSVAKVLPLRCHLLALPSEIKLLIYQYVTHTWELRPLNAKGRFNILDLNTPLEEVRKKSLPYVLNCGITGWARFDRNFDPSLLQTCREIYFEAQPIFYRQIDVVAQFKDLAGFEQTTRTLSESPFRYIRTFGFSIVTSQLSGYPKDSFTRLKNALEAMPYLKKVGDITTIIALQITGGRTRVPPVVANLVELNDSSKPISNVLVSRLSYEMFGIFGPPEIIIEELTKHSIPVARLFNSCKH